MATKEIKSGESSSEMKIDEDSNAIRISPYGVPVDVVGARKVKGTKRTYRASFANTRTVGTGYTGMFFAMTGAVSGPAILVTIQRIFLSGLHCSTIGYHDVVAEKWSSSPTGGSPNSMIKIPLDSDSAASDIGLCETYTGTTPPTEGTLLGTIASKRILVQSVTAVAGSYLASVEFDFRIRASETQGIVLGNTNETFSLAFGTGPLANDMTYSLDVEWTEEDV